MTTVIAVVVDVSIVTALGLFACVLLRRRTASLRHLILAASLAAAAAAPLLEATLPRWELPVLSGDSQVATSQMAFSSESTSESAVVTTSPEASTFGWTAALVTVWAFGASVVLAGLFVGFLRLFAVTRRCRPVTSGLWLECAERLSRQYSLTAPFRMLESPDRAVLLTWGVLQPRIIVPSGAMSWTRGRIEVVLAHEMAHIARRDWALQIAAETLRALHWFNPLIWLACRRLRDESEQACDDTGLGRGIDAVDYASHLVAVARHVITADRGWASAPAIANASTLERRVAAMLNSTRNREPLTSTARVLTAMAVLAVIVPLAAATLTERVVAATTAQAISHDVPLTAPAPRRLTPRAAAAATPAAAQQKPASLSGVLRDASGGVLPGVMVTMTDTAAGMIYRSVSDATGAFIVRNLPPATYQFKAVLPGFSSVEFSVTLTSGEEAERRMEMKVGSLMETVTVTCPVGTAHAPQATPAVLAFGRRNAASPLFARQTPPIRVGGQIAAPRQVKRVQPLCPNVQLPANGYVVILESTIGADGLVKEVTTLRPKPGEQPRELAQAAIDAVRQWEYTPTRLNNVPVPVIMTVTVNFTRQ